MSRSTSVTPEYVPVTPPVPMKYYAQTPTVDDLGEDATLKWGGSSTPEDEKYGVIKASMMEASISPEVDKIITTEMAKSSVHLTSDESPSPVPEEENQVIFDTLCFCYCCIQKIIYFHSISQILMK